MPTWIKQACESWLWLTDTTGGTATNALIDGAGYSRAGGNCYSRAGLYSGSRELVVFANSSLTRGFGSNLSEGHHQFWWETSTVLAALPFKIMDGGAEQLSLRCTADGAILVSRNGTTLATSAAGVIVPNIRVWIQFRWTIADSGGVAVVRVNNVEVINFTGDTKATANAYATSFALNHNGSGLSYFGELVSYSDSGSWPLEECRYKRLIPDAAGNSTQFTPLASTNVSQIDEQQSDSDTTYNSSTTPGNIDLFGTDAALDSGDTVLAILEESWGEKTDAGARDFRQVLRINSTNYESSSHSLTSAYARYVNLRDTNPDTASAWTPTVINAMEIGYKDQA